MEGENVPVVHIKKLLGKTAWASPASGKANTSMGLLLFKDLRRRMGGKSDVYLKWA